MESPFEDILVVVAGTLAWLMLLALLSRFNRRRKRNGQPVNWGGLLLVAAITGVVTAVGYRAYSTQGSPTPDPALQAETGPGR